MLILVCHFVTDKFPQESGSSGAQPEPQPKPKSKEPDLPKKLDKGTEKASKSKDSDKSFAASAKIPGSRNETRVRT